MSSRPKPAARRSRSPSTACASSFFPRSSSDLASRRKASSRARTCFTLPALAPIVYNAATILGAIVLGPRIGVYGVAIGVVAGAIGFLLLQIPGLMRSGMRYSFSFDPRTPGVSEVARLLAPRLIGQAAFQLNFIAVTNLAWRTGEQSVSALNYAWQLLMLPHGVLALSVSTVILPTLSRLWQAGDTVAFRATLGNALRPLLFLSLPAAVILFAFRLPIVQTLFQTGAFSAESTSPRRGAAGLSGRGSRQLCPGRGADTRVLRHARHADARHCRHWHRCTQHRRRCRAARSDGLPGAGPGAECEHDGRGHHSDRCSWSTDWGCDGEYPGLAAEGHRMRQRSHGAVSPPFWPIRSPRPPRREMDPGFNRSLFFSSRLASSAWSTSAVPGCCAFPRCRKSSIISSGVSRRCVASRPCARH